MAVFPRLADYLLPVFMLLMLAVPAHALDAMRLDSRFSVTHLSPLITEREPTPLFAVRNGDDSRLLCLSPVRRCRFCCALSCPKPRRRPACGCLPPMIRSLPPRRTGPAI